MAFEDFQDNTPVIILGKNSAGQADTSQEDIYKRTRIEDGADATPDIFNTSIQDSINRDVSLEAALTYLARSASLYTTDNTKFLSHCEGDGIDVISYKKPNVGESTTANVFVSDDQFLGAAYPQGYLENMIWANKGTTIATLCPCSTKGWTRSIQSTWVSGDDYTIVENESEDNPYTKITTVKDAATSRKAGFVTYTMNKCTTGVHRDGSGILTDAEKVSASFYLKTEDSMVLTNTEITFSLRFYATLDSSTYLKDSSGNPIGASITINDKSDYDGMITLENIEVPTVEGTQLAKAFDLVIDVRFNSLTTGATFYLSRVMVQDGENCTFYLPENASDSTCQYDDVIDLASNNYTASVTCWCKFRNYSLKTITGTGIGPLFLSFGGNFSIGCLHLKTSGTTLKFQIATKTGTAEYVTTSTEVEIPSDYIDKYLLTSLRFRPDTTDTTKVIAEVAFIVSNKVYTSSMTVDKSLLSGKGTIIAGYDFDNRSETYTSTLDYFEGPVTEIRYDNEWLNDLELYVVSLTKKPFSFKQSTDSQITTKTKSVTEELDEAGINLVPNPTGRMGLVNWNAEEGSTYYTVNHTDSMLGNCFNFTGNVGSGSTRVLYTNPITINTNGGVATTYTLRAVMRSASGNVGVAGIGIRFLAAGETFSPTALRTNDLLLNVVHNGKIAYYSGNIITNTDTTKAVVYLYVDGSASISSLSWTKIKFEEGKAATYFTDDSGAAYAVYAE